MRRILLTSAICVLLSATAQAACFGGPNYTTCTENDGTQYSVNRFGNTTQLQGHNNQTGSNWSQTSQTFGNTTTHNGMVNGNPWNMTENHFGNMATYNGMNAKGQPFHYTCNQFGCQ